MRRLKTWLVSVALILGVLSISLGAQNFIWGSVNGIPFGPGLILNGPAKIADGTVSAPSLTFNSDPDTGIYHNEDADRISFAAGANLVAQIGVAYLAVTSNVGSFKLGAAQDVVLTWIAANTLGLKNGAALQAFRVYDASGTGYTALSGTGLTTYKNVTTAGWGVPAIQGYGDVAAATNTGTASIATYTVGASDGTFEVGCNILVTTSTNHTFSCDVTYTDEAGGARTQVLPMAIAAGTFATTGLITNTTGVGTYISPMMTIRADAATAITVRTSAGGTFTTVVYNARGVIKQVG